jgi:hypothetical protein
MGLTIKCLYNRISIDNIDPQENVRPTEIPKIQISLFARKLQKVGLISNKRN